MRALSRRDLRALDQDADAQHDARDRRRRDPGAVRRQQASRSRTTSPHARRCDGARYVRIDSQARRAPGLPRDARSSAATIARTSPASRSRARGGRAPIGERDRILPISLDARAEGLRYKGYSVMVKERPGLRARASVGADLHLLPQHRAVPRRDARRARWPGETRAVPGRGRRRPRCPKDAPTRRLEVDAIQRRSRAMRSLDENDGASSARDGATAAAIERATSSRRARASSERHLVEVGIGCESCHVGCAASTCTIRAKRRRSSRARRSCGQSTPARRAGRSRSTAPARAAIRCSSRGYPFTWEGGMRANAPGGSHINSGEARDLLLGACALEAGVRRVPRSARARRRARCAQLERRAANAVCTKCHEQLA